MIDGLREEAGTVLPVTTPRGIPTPMPTRATTRSTQTQLWKTTQRSFGQSKYRHNRPPDPSE